LRRKDLFPKLMPRTHDGGPAILEAPSASLNSIPRFRYMQLPFGRCRNSLLGHFRDSNGEHMARNRIHSRLRGGT
jgi:hypothetical protein